MAIINPASNGGKTAEKWPGFYNYFNNSNLEIEEVYTEYRGHAVELAKYALFNGYNYIMAVGGDGTLNEIINGLIEKDKLLNPDLKLIIFSQGTGSDLIRTLNISSQVKDIFKNIKRGKIEKIDIIKAAYTNKENDRESRYFVNAADCGMGAEVAARVNKKNKTKTGSISYLSAVLLSLFKYRNKEVEIYADGLKIYNGRLNTVIAANGKYFGGGIKIAPDAELSSRQINVVLLKDFSRLGIILNLIKGYKGSHLKHPKVDSFKAKTLKIYSKPKMNLEVDGENIAETPVLFSVLEDQLSVIV
ncbi:MAG: diacylglycerol/lipid kinase family protein [Halanaerobium sp.]